METFSALLAICAGNSPVPGEFPTQRPVTRSFDVFLDLRLNKRLSKQWQDWWFETLSRPLYRHRNGNRNVHEYIFLSQNVALWDIRLMHCGICKMGLLPQKLMSNALMSNITQYYSAMILVVPVLCSYGLLKFNSLWLRGSMWPRRRTCSMARHYLNQSTNRQTHFTDAGDPSSGLSRTSAGL